jgi:hypothetical protein
MHNVDNGQRHPYVRKRNLSNETCLVNTQVIQCYIYAVTLFLEVAIRRPGNGGHCSQGVGSIDCN